MNFLGENSMTRKMKDSGIEWIGEIPEDWEVVKVKHEYDFSTGFTPETNRTEYYDDENGYEWVNISDLDGSKFLSKQTKNKISKTYINLYKPKSVPQGSLMYSFKLSVGQRTFNVRETYTNEAIASFMNNKNIDLNYFYYSSRLIAYNSYKNIYGARILNQELIKNAPVPFPSLEEQYKISSFLDKKVEQIEDIEKTIIKEIENLENYKKSLITEAVTKGLDKNVEMKDSGIEWIGDIPRHWEVKRLKQLLSNDPDSLKVGPFGSALKSSDLVNNGKWVYNQRTVLDGNFINNDTFIDDKKFVELRGFKVKAGDILLTTRGTIGKIAIVPSGFYEGVIHPCIIKFNLNKELFENELIRFIFNHTDLVLKQVEFLSNSTTIGVIYSYNLVNIYIPIPPISEQNQIIDYLNKKTKSIDETISLKQKQLETLEEYKKSLIYEYVTGKKEVKDGEES